MATRKKSKRFTGLDLITVTLPDGAKLKTDKDGQPIEAEPTKKKPKKPRS